MNAITNAQKELKQLVAKEEIVDAFRRISRENAGALIASMLTAVNLNDQLKHAAPMTVINCALLAASLDLPIEQNLGQAWIIPYKKNGLVQAQFQIGYKGLIQLALRSGQYKTIHAGVIYNGMVVRTNPITGEVTVTGEAVSDEPIGYVGYLETLNGYSHTVYMTKEEVAGHAKKYSKTWGFEGSPWTTHFDEMAKKTVLKRLLTKYGILSVKMTRAMNADATQMDAMDMSDLAPKFVDAQVKDVKARSREALLEEMSGEAQPRPWSALYIREKVVSWTLDYQSSGAHASDQTRNILAGVLDRVTGDKTKRYEICQYLTGKSSTKDMDTEVNALLNWLGVHKFDDIPNQDVLREIANVHNAALKEKGQMEMVGAA